MSQDPLVAPHLMAWMASAAPTGSDDFNQAFGFNALTGDHGSKQGWTDPGRSPVNLHSVGWTDRYFAAILQNSDTATYAVMRETSTHTATMIASAGEPPVADAAPEPADPQPTVSDPTPLPPAASTAAPEPPAASDRPPAPSGPTTATSIATTSGSDSPPAAAETPLAADPPVATDPPLVAAGGSDAPGASPAQLDESAILAGWVAAVSAPDGPVDTARAVAHTIAWSDPVKNLPIGRLFARMLVDDARC